MNDFTKEELELLGASVFGKWVHSLVDPSINHLTSRCKNLDDKIQSMLDNYCEHSWVYYSSHDGSYVFCQKCKKRL